jgi:hypothetical protein
MSRTDSVAHPEASGLIFWPDRYFDTGHEPTAEEIVDAALAHQPIQLGPADSPPAYGRQIPRTIHRLCAISPIHRARTRPSRRSCGRR